jgi:hypothetical protein
MSFREPIINNITQVFQKNATSHVRAVMLGSGLGYALPNGYWHHTPLIIINPFAYAAYQIFVSQTDVIKWGKQTLQEFR